MISGAPLIRDLDGGDPPCWAHVFDDTRADIVDRDDIEHLVRDFYRSAAMDDVLGPVSEAAHVNWNAHIATSIDFWSWQLLGEPGCCGRHHRGAIVHSDRGSQFRSRAFDARLKHHGMTGCRVPFPGRAESRV